MANVGLAIRVHPELLSLLSLMIPTNPGGQVAKRLYPIKIKPRFANKTWQIDSLFNPLLFLGLKRPVTDLAILFQGGGRQVTERDAEFDGADSWGKWPACRSANFQAAATRADR